MPEKPTLLDFFKYRFGTATHVMQSAGRALKTGMDEKVVLACLLHDVVNNLLRSDHGWWGGQLIEPYVPPGDRLRGPLSLDAALLPGLGLWLRVSGKLPPRVRRGLRAEPYLQRTYERVRKHKWYEYSRLVTVNDLYAFDRSKTVSIEPFIDIIGRHFKQPKEGLGWDDSPSSHMWRTIINPDRRL